MSYQGMMLVLVFTVSCFGFGGMWIMLVFKAPGMVFV